MNLLLCILGSIVSGLALYRIILGSTNRLLPFCIPIVLVCYWGFISVYVNPVSDMHLFVSIFVFILILALYSSLYEEVLQHKHPTRLFDFIYTISFGFTYGFLSWLILC